MRRARFQLSAWECHPSNPRFLGRCPVAGCELPRHNTACGSHARENRRRRGAFSRGWKSSAGGVAGECPSNVQRQQPRSASGLTFRSEGRQLRAGRPPICSQDPTSSVPRRRGRLPHGDDRLRGQAQPKMGRATLRILPHRLDRLAYARREPGRPRLPGAACGTRFRCLLV
jgi:hypothetical protein